MSSRSLEVPRVLVLSAGPPRSRILQFFRSYPMAAVGGSLLIVVLALATLGVWLALFDRLEFNSNERLVSHSWPHVLGTDDRGRDELSRLAMLVECL